MHTTHYKRCTRLFFFSDKDQLSFSEISGDGLPPRVYPMCGAQVFVRHDFDHHEQFRQIATDIFNGIGRFTENVVDHAA